MRAGMRRAQGALSFGLVGRLRPRGRLANEPLQGVQAGKDAPEGDRRDDGHAQDRSQPGDGA